jgi:hypothetical protein
MEGQRKRQGQTKRKRRIEGYYDDDDQSAKEGAISRKEYWSYEKQFNSIHTALLSLQSRFRLTGTEQDEKNKTKRQIIYMKMFRSIVQDDDSIDVDMLWTYTKQLTSLALFAQDCEIVRNELDMIVLIVRNEIRYSMEREKLR